MPVSDPAALSLKWSFHLADSLYHSGVRHAFISPGSRSTPLTLALAHYRGITCHSVLDERSAGFMALGAAKETGFPALFVCTSGTAVSNAFPAVTEARMSATPLIVLTADRPPSMRATGSSQTIDQIKIFGNYPVFFFDTGEPVDSPIDFRRLARLGSQAVYYAQVRGGPVHLNLPFRKPLEPGINQIKECVKSYGQNLSMQEDTRRESPVPGNTTPDPTGLERSARDSPGPGDSDPLFNADRFRGKLAIVPDDGLLPIPETVRKMIAGCKRPVVIAGPGSDTRSSIFGWSRRHAVPVLSETGNIAGSITKHPLLLGDVAAARSLSPDLVIRTGGEPIHRPTLTALHHWHVPQIRFEDLPDLNDSTLSATHHVPNQAEAYDWQNILQEHSFADWHRLWLDKSQKAEAIQTEALDKERLLTDGHVYRHLLPFLAETPDIRTVVSNSFPIRDFLLFGLQDDVNQLPVAVNRGASGIDGVTSTAVGAAISTGKPTVLFIGDLAFLHDITALNNLADRELDLKIVIINNRGGSIFRMLPFEERDEVYTRFIETPQQVDLFEIAKAHHLPFERVKTPEDLAGGWNRLASHKTGILECLTNSSASMHHRNPV